MKKAKAKKKARNPTDATMRNVRARNKKFDRTEQRLEVLMGEMRWVFKWLERLEYRIELIDPSIR